MNAQQLEEKLEGDVTAASKALLAEKDPANREELRMMWKQAEERLDSFRRQQVAGGKRGREAGNESDDEAGASKRPRAGHQDRSLHWVTFLEGPLPQLPSTPKEVEATLFPDQSNIRLPVTELYHAGVVLHYTELVAQHLEPADPSSLVVTLTELLQTETEEHLSEEATHHLVVELISKVFKCLSKFSRIAGRIKHSIFQNTTEPQRSTSSKAVQDRLRPDTIVVMNQCTLLLGEDKVGNIKLAMKDLERKRRPLHALHYGDVRFLLAYAAAGTEFQWLWMSSDGRLVKQLGRLFDLSQELDRLELVLSLVHAYYLMVVMARSVPEVIGRLPLYGMINRGSWGREESRHLVVQPNSMRKVIRNFDTFAEEFQADFENIKAAYAAADLAAQQSSPPFLVATSRPPKLRGGQYEVEIKPLGYEASCTNEQDVRALACACCKATQVLHRAGFVHRDLRMANIVQLGPLAYMVIDLETVGRRRAEGQRKPEPLKEGFFMNGWDTKTLTKSRRYNGYSDMHQIGLLINELLREVVHHPSKEALDFVQQLMDKKLSASCALKDAWFELVI